MQNDKGRIVRAIEEEARRIIEFAQAIWREPELGYKEFKTAQRLADGLGSLGIEIEEGLALTGVRGSLTGGKKGPRIALLGELDAISCPNHPEASPEGLKHACGHHLQLAIIYGVAIGLTKSGVMPDLSGVIDFWGVPAEEFIDLEYRERIRQEEKIKYFGGKPELLRLGYFDHTDIFLMGHSAVMDECYSYSLGDTSNSFMAQKIIYIGQEAHAGAEPHKGINALSAANLALQAIHSQRETFREEDKIRVHPIITQGGDIVNVVPARVTLETYIRAASLEALEETLHKVNRCWQAGALALGAEVEVRQEMGYLSLIHDIQLKDIFSQNAHVLIGSNGATKPQHLTGSFDFGDVGHLKPSLHPFFAGVSGGLHARDFKVTDYQKACIKPAQIFATMIYDLLSNEGKKAQEVIANFTPKLTKDEYLNLQMKNSVSWQFKG